MILEFATYKDYLASELWKAIRKAVFERSPNCYRCGKKGQVVHHTSYAAKVMRGDDNSKLITLCFSCHHFIEFANDGVTKLTTKEANKRLYSSKHTQPRRRGRIVKKFKHTRKHAQEILETIRRLDESCSFVIE